MLAAMIAAGHRGYNIAYSPLLAGMLAAGHRGDPIAYRPLVYSLARTRPAIEGTP
jgi:hypothetical protein